MLCIPEEYSYPRGIFEELFAGFEGRVHDLTRGRGLEEEEEFRHLMLELAAIVGTENDFVRRWLEEEEKTRKERDLKISGWRFLARGGANYEQDPIV